jgi:hypothetical protein
MTYVLIAAVVLALVYEVYWIVTESKSNGTVQGMTISELVWHVSTKRPIVPFAFGVLMGHFFAIPAAS